MMMNSEGVDYSKLTGPEIAPRKYGLKFRNRQAQVVLRSRTAC